MIQITANDLALAILYAGMAGGLFALLVSMAITFVRSFFESAAKS